MLASCFQAWYFAFSTTFQPHGLASYMGGGGHVRSGSIPPGRLSRHCHASLLRLQAMQLTLQGPRVACLCRPYSSSRVSWLIWFSGAET